MEKKIIDARRTRKIQGSFGWIDHRLITGGFVERMSLEEIALYLFLSAVADRNGLSYYGDVRLCSLLKIDLGALGEARRRLIAGSLIAYEAPLYQVLSLPEAPVEGAQEKPDYDRNLKQIERIRKQLRDGR